MTLLTTRLAALGGLLAGALGALVFLPAAATAQDANVRMPEPWQLWLQQPTTPVADGIYGFHIFLLWVTIAIAVFVLALMIYVCLKFRASKNPNPSRTSHHTVIEIIWTAVPVIILLVIAIPSYKHLKFSDRAVDPEMTVKVIGNQWFWSYEYPDEEIAFSSYLIREGSAEYDPATHTRLLDVDNRLVVPVGKRIQVLVTSNDVFHSFFIPSAMVQVYAVGGRTNETWMEFNEPGVYYGQCNQICGVDHSNMPIVVEAVSQQDWDAWLPAAKERFAMDNGPAGRTRVAETASAAR